MNGTGNTIKGIMGERLRTARESKGFSRQKLVDILNSHAKAPAFALAPGRALQMGTYRKWESGENPVDVRWIPALCDVLGVDVGYLFGEYPEKTRAASDVCAVTGLSEKGAAGLIQAYKADDVADDWNYTYPPYSPDGQQYRDNIHYVVDDILSTSSGHELLKVLFTVWKKRQFVKSVFENWTNMPEKARKGVPFRCYTTVGQAFGDLRSAKLELQDAMSRFVDDVYDYAAAHKLCDDYMNGKTK